jgi:general secretion pathway protein G
MIVRTRRAAARAAFTLMEVLVVVMILVILAGTGGVIYFNYLQGAKRDRARIDLASLTEQVEIYRMKYGSYPASLAALTQPMPDNTPAILEPSALLDPWQHEYQYSVQGSHRPGKPDIWTQGDPSDPSSIVGNWSSSPGQ